MEVKIKSMKYEDFNDNEYLESLKQLREGGCDVIVGSLDDLFALDGAARARAHTLIEELG